MKVLVVGQGGREHAIVRSLRLSPSVTEVHALPGSDGIALEAVCHKAPLRDHAMVLDIVRKMNIDLVVVGPEVPLAEGMSDFLRDHQVLVFGPSQEAAQLESSKVYSKRFMVDAQLPTARFEVVRTVAETMQAAAQFAPPYVLKADGLAAGKGVYICQTQAELRQAAEALFVHRELGDAGAQALLEEFSHGWELSYLILTNGVEYQALPLAQDHKRLLDQDLGPNTGGMGVVAPLQISPQLEEQIRSQVVEPTLKQMQNRKMLYRGVLYIGLMITERGPSVLEYNVRFGDPEAQSLLPLIAGDCGQIFKSIANGQVPALKFKPLTTACVVLAAQGYPKDPVKGIRIEGDVLKETPSSYFLHAGSARSSAQQWVTQGGRVLNAIGIGSNLVEAQRNAYAQASLVRWPGMQMRLDIGNKVIKQMQQDQEMQP